MLRRCQFLRSEREKIKDRITKLDERDNELKAELSEFEKVDDRFTEMAEARGKSVLQVLMEIQEEEVSPDTARLRRSGRVRKRTRPYSPNGDSRKRRKIPEESPPSSDADDEEESHSSCHPSDDEECDAFMLACDPSDDEEEEEPKKDSGGGDTTEKEKDHNRYQFEWNCNGFLNTGWRYEGFEKVDHHGDVLCERCKTPLTYVHTLVHPQENNRKIRIGCICAFWCCEDMFVCPCDSGHQWTKGVCCWYPVPGTDREKYLEIDDGAYAKCFLIVFPARVDEYGWKWEIGTTPYRKEERYQRKQTDVSFYRTRREAYEEGLKWFRGETEHVGSSCKEIDPPEIDL